VLAYLNPSWTPEQGGALRLFPPTKEGGGKEEGGKEEGGEGSASKMRAIDVAPLGGRVAMFYSADIPHEVSGTL
jgi:hypothetical protein